MRLRSRKHERPRDALLANWGRQGGQGRNSRCSGTPCDDTDAAWQATTAHETSLGQSSRVERSVTIFSLSSRGKNNAVAKDEEKESKCFEGLRRDRMIVPAVAPHRVAPSRDTWKRQRSSRCCR